MFHEVYLIFKCYFVIEYSAWYIQTKVAVVKLYWNVHQKVYLQSTSQSTEINVKCVLYHRERVV